MATLNHAGPGFTPPICAADRPAALNARADKGAEAQIAIGSAVFKPRSADPLD